MCYDAVVGRTTCIGLLDPEATDNFVFPELARVASLNLNICSVEVELGDGPSVKVNQVEYEMIGLEGAKSKQKFYILDLCEETPLILERSWLRIQNPKVDWQSYVMQFEDKAGKLREVHPRGETCRKKPCLKLITVKRMKRTDEKRTR